MLAHFRQFAQPFARTLLGMLLFVWLTMALAPCVMAYSEPFSELTQVKADSGMSMAAAHEKMADCGYCPQNKADMGTIMLCQNSHDSVSDTLTFMVDSVGVDSFILFEIPASIQINPLHAGNVLAFSQQVTKLYGLSPLVLTGILRI